MLIRKASILTLICVFFAFTFVVINIALVIEYKRQQSDLYYFAFQRFIMAARILHTPSEDQKTSLEKVGVRIVEMDKHLLDSAGEKLLEDPFSHMVLFEKRLFFVPNPPPPLPQMPFAGDRPMDFGLPMKQKPLEQPILESVEVYSPYRLWILGGVINILLVLFFMTVFQKLFRLRQLKSDIRHVGERKKFHPIAIESEDELGEIALEFNLAMEKIHMLKEARTLFLRNILHELKTPIMKGKLLSNTLENNQKQEQMERIFERLETLLGEMVKIEKLSSNEWVLEAKEYRLVDVLDHAMDLLLCDTKRIHFCHHEEAPLLSVDFELFATAVKNLLDNALKHSSEAIEVDVDAHALTVGSYGEALLESSRDFSRPFNRTTEGSSNGLGLGLYIANAIVEKHGFRLSYLYAEGQNFFTIHFDASV